MDTPYQRILAKLQQYATGPIYYREKEQRARAAQQAQDELDALVLTIREETWDAAAKQFVEMQDGHDWVAPEPEANPYREERR